jgi:hypothetical protein
MTRRRAIVTLALLATLVAASAIATVRRRAFASQIDREIADLLAARKPLPQIPVEAADLESLPEPVQRWMRASGVVGTAIPSVVRLTQQGEFRLGRDKPWMPMSATQYYTTNPPGFLWHASMEIFPLVSVSGRDRYQAGAGDIEMRVVALVPVASKSGGNLNSGALLRYLNETMWFPAALLLPNVAWEPIDGSSTRATLTDAGQSVSAVFVFDEQDRLIDMTADRWNDAEQAIRPWSTPVGSWGEFEGLQIATSGTGVWNTGPDAYDYIRLHLTSVEYDPRALVRP